MGHDALLNLGAFALQVCVIAGAATLLLAAVRIASAGARYVCWRVVLAACLVMPVLLQRPVTVASVGEPVTLSNESISVGSSPAITPTTVDAVPAIPHEPLPWTALAVLVIASGAAARMMWLAGGLLRLRTLRRRGVVVEDGEYAEIQGTLGTRATLLKVGELNQPATFGLWRPVVLLPDTLAASPEALRLAVVTHELFHVQRRDWLWVLAEEALRSLFWFHPAISWITSRIQLAREEVVDELTVLATGNRKAYIEALLAFADAGHVQPAPAFARRRHLFTRILRLSKESVMSSPRVVLSTATVIAVVFTAGWYASSVFPILAAAPAETAQSTHTQPSTVLPRYQVDRLLAFLAGQSGPVAAPSGQALDASAAVPAIVQGRPAPKTATTPGDTPHWNDYLREAQDSLRVLTENSGGFRVVSQSDLEAGLKRVNNELGAQGARSGGAPRPGPATVAAPAPAPGTKEITPENPIPRRLSSVPVPYPAQLKGSGYRANLMVRVTLEASGAVSDVRQVSIETAGGDATSPDGRVRAVEAFAAAAAEAVKQWRYQPPADPPIAFFVAVTFEGERDALAVQSESPAGQGPWSTSTVRFNLPTAATPADMERLDRLLTDMLARRAEFAQRLQPGHPDLQKLDEQIREIERARNLQQRGVATVASVAGPGSTAATPVRVGGNIPPPTKTNNVSPDYPEIAKVARVQGVVILETTIDEQGRVANARVLRSIPLLDQAALDAVRLWQFTPTLLNGSPVPVIMTVTVQFGLPPQ